MHPDPPDLKEVAEDEPRIIFWTIKHGVNMTGMPSFAKIGADDKEIWQITAFVKKFGSVKPEEILKAGPACRRPSLSLRGAHSAPKQSPPHAHAQVK